MAKINLGRVKGDPGPQGRDGQKGENGKNGKDATVNGHNVVRIEKGDNIDIQQIGNTLTISATVNGKSTVESVNSKTGVVVLGADDIRFRDGDTFQQKFDRGDLNGEDGKGVEDELKTVSAIGSTITLTEDKYQSATLNGTVTVNFPKVSGFKVIHLFVKTGHSAPTLKISNCIWQNKKTPVVEGNKQYEFIFTTLTGLEWLGGAVVYEQ